MNAVASGFANAIFAITIVACSASGTTASSSDGADAAVLGECAPPVALLPVSGKNVWPNSAVPRGSCAGTNTCQILVDPCCQPVAGEDPIDHYTCECQQGVWQCTVVRGTSICANLDAGDFSSCPETGN
jgi:hypothetical protein